MSCKSLLQVHSLRVIFFIMCMQYASSGYAYIGPGAGISSIGMAVAFLAVLFFLFVGFVWYPIKSIFFNKKKNTGVVDKDLDKDSDQARKL